MTTATKNLTAEEFAQLPADGMRHELVRGKVIMTPPPGYEHGSIQMQIAVLIQPYLNQHHLGRIVGEVGVILARQPDTVRGPDAAYYSPSRIPPGTRPRGYPGVLPELVFEVRSPSDRWNDVMDKVNEYLVVGIIVVVIDPGPQAVHVFEPNHLARVLGPTDMFDLPALWPGLAFPVADLFT